MNEMILAIITPLIGFWIGWHISKLLTKLCTSLYDSFKNK